MASLLDTWRLCPADLKCPSLQRSVHFRGRCTAPFVASGRAARKLMSHHAIAQLEADPQSAPLEWLADKCGDTSTLKLRRCYLGEDYGWGMAATQDVKPGGVLLSVPLTYAITSEGADQSMWSIGMANELLQQVSLGAASEIEPWVSALPQHVPLPWLYYSEEELAAMQDQQTLAECRKFSAIYEAAQEGSPYPPEQVAWALSMVHSRSFLYGGFHVFCPGIDGCNHSPTPSASVRCVRLPSQGEGDGGEASQPEPPRFELVAGKHGIRAGEEVTISYGRWPSSIFLLNFGFLPASDPSADSVVLFQGLAELALRWHVLMSTAQHDSAQHDGVAGQPSSPPEDVLSPEAQHRVLQLWREALRSGALDMADFSRLAVTGSGVVDARLVKATNVLIQLYPAVFGTPAAAAAADGFSADGEEQRISSGQGSSSGNDVGAPGPQPPSPRDFFKLRCQELLSAYPTSREEDVAWLAEQGAAASDNLRTAVRFRMGIKALLLAAARQLEGAAKA